MITQLIRQKNNSLSIEKEIVTSFSMIKNLRVSSNGKSRVVTFGKHKVDFDTHKS
jgi:hypothetical protein